MKKYFEDELLQINNDDNDKFFKEIKQKTEFNYMFNAIFTKFSNDLLKECNKIVLDQDLSKDYKIGVQNGVLAALTILLNTRDRMVNKDENN